MEQKSKFVNLGSLWKTQNGKTIEMSGTLIDGAKVVIMKNSKKESGSKQPDYNICAVIEKK